MRMIEKNSGRIRRANSSENRNERQYFANAEPSTSASGSIMLSTYTQPHACDRVGPSIFLISSGLASRYRSITERNQHVSTS